MAPGAQIVIDLDLDNEQHNNNNNNDDDNNNAANLSIPELISSLQSTFQAKYFTEVESILTSREGKSKLEMDNLKKENELLVQKFESERLSKINIETELQKYKTEIWELRDENSRLREDKKVISERESCTEERMKALVEEVNRMGQVDKEAILELRTKNCEAESAKRKAENEVEIWKRRFGELERRVSCLAEEIEILMKAGPPVPLPPTPPPPPPPRGLEVGGVNCGGLEKRSEKFVEVKNEGDNVGPSCGSLVKVNGVNGDLPSTGGRPSSRNVVEIIDSDDDCAPVSILSGKDMTSQRPADNAHSGQTGVVSENKMLKRKLASWLRGNENGDNYDDSEDVGDNSPNGKCKIKKLQESLHEPAGSPVNHGSATALSSASNDVGKFVTPSRQDPTILRRCEEIERAEHNSRSLMSDPLLKGYDLYDSDSSTSSDSDDDADLNFDFPMFGFESQRNRVVKKWGSEAEMLAVFEKDTEPCMEAVCALYRQQICAGKSPRDLLSSGNRGFNKADACRGTTLAKFLIDGDPRGQLKKSIKELLEYDRKGLDDCKRLAIEHSKQLFEIYQKKEDPLFYP